MNNNSNNGTLQCAVTYAGAPGQSPSSFSASFSYDSLNRLTGISEPGNYSRGFSYDPYGNMWVNLAGTSGITPAGNTPTSNVYNGANQISGANYDAAGNLQSANGFWITYDAENRQAQVADIPALGGGTETLIYDGLGQRVQKILPSGTTVYVYDAFGQLAAEYSSNPPISAPCTTCYLSYDHLSSLRMVTDQYTNVIARHDYLPFGEEIPANTAGRGSQWDAADGVTQRFTGQIRDSETSLDYFNARYLTGALGRFSSPDRGNAGADSIDPQTWNAYAYVRNNPLALVDPDGTSDCNPSPGSLTCVEHDESLPSPEKPRDPPPPGLNLLEEMVYSLLFQMAHGGQVTGQAVAEAGNWLAQPRDPGCMLGAIAKGGAIGTGTGMIAGGLVGIESGPGAVLTAGGEGAVGGPAGAFVGDIFGLSACMSSTGGGGGNPTKHGAQRVTGRKFSPEEIADAKTGERYEQADGAVAFVKRVGRNSYNVLVENAGGQIVTGMKDLSKQEVRNLAANYGWH